LSALQQQGRGGTRRWFRAILAGPVVFLTSVVVMAACALWVPEGAASIDNLVLPIVLFPVIWAALFFYACLDRKLLRAWGLVLVMLALNGIAIGTQFLGGPAT
tara:strand:+ start:16563 stop:16871 length:309 start_codon:yes stop_codon:yes gene_type:complete